MTACRIRPWLVALLLLVFVCQTLAASAIYCQSQGRQSPAPMAMHPDAMNMPMHDHSMHHPHGNPDTTSHTAKADCCSTKGECHLACSLAVTSAGLPLAINLSSPVADNYLGLMPAGVFSSVYKPPISA